MDSLSLQTIRYAAKFIPFYIAGNLILDRSSRIEVQVLFYVQDHLL